MNAPAPTELLLKLIDEMRPMTDNWSNDWTGERSRQEVIMLVQGRMKKLVDAADAVRQAASVGAEVAGEAVAWRIHPDDTLFLRGATVTDEKGIAEIWERAGNRIEPLGVLASPSRSEGVSKGEVAQPSNPPIADIQAAIDRTSEYNGAARSEGDPS